MVYSQVLLLHELEEENRAVGVDLCIGLANRPGPGLEVAKTPGGGVPVSERGGQVGRLTVRAHHHDGSGGSERAAPNRDTLLAWRVQGLLEMKGTGRAKIMAAGVGPSITHELGLGQGRLAPLKKTRLGACRTYASGLNMAKAMGDPRLPGIHQHREAA